MDDRGLLKDIRDSYEGSSVYDDISRLAAIKLMTSLMEGREANIETGSSLALGPNAIASCKRLGNQEMVSLTIGDVLHYYGLPRLLKMIEAHWTEAVGRELYFRVS